MEPALLRKSILSHRDALSKDEIRERSLHAIQRLLNTPWFASSTYPLFFISFRSEIYTHDLIKDRLTEGLIVLVPKSIVTEHRLEIYRIQDWEQDLVTGAYGILEPRTETTERIQDPAVIDSVLVPGSVFDRRCGRYGYGGGFYDRFLSGEALNAVRIGLAFHFQIMDHIPLAPHDQRLDIIVTDQETVLCSGSGRG